MRIVSMRNSGWEKSKVNFLLRSHNPHALKMESNEERLNIRQCQLPSWYPDSSVQSSLSVHPKPDVSPDAPPKWLPFQHTDLLCISWFSPSEEKCKQRFTKMVKNTAWVLYIIAWFPSIRRSLHGLVEYCTAITNFQNSTMTNFQSIRKEKHCSVCKNLQEPGIHKSISDNKWYNQDSL